MLAENANDIASDQRRRFNRLVDVFDAPQPQDVMDRLRRIVDAAGIRPGETVLDVGAGVGVLIPLIESFRPSRILACDLAEQMLARVHRKYPQVGALQGDVVWCPLRTASVDVVFMNAMFGNIADKPAACAHAARILKPGGRLVVSHPEGKAFVDYLRATTDFFIESLPTRTGFQSLVEPLGFEIVTWQDEPKLYVVVARKIEGI
jgi:SAM-dependent methyltransferase